MLSKSGQQAGTRPPAAVEIAAEGVLAAALPGPGQAPAYAFEALREGALLPGIGEPNLRDAQAVADAIRAVLEQLPVRGRHVTLVLPDSAVRVFVLDFDSLPTKSAEADPIIRFRLRKMVPFDVEHAGLCYQVLTAKKNEVRVLVVVLPAAILAEYETAVRLAGYEPGTVLPSSLAALATIDSLEAVLTANLTEAALTTAISNGDDLLLYRTLDLPVDAEMRISEVRRGIAVAAAYFEDKLGGRPSRLLYAGSDGSAAFAKLIAGQWLAVEPWCERPETGAVTTLGTTSIAGVTGALAGAR
jgi:type IV pilus assembly protein PilM